MTPILIVARVFFDAMFEFDNEIGVASITQNTSTEPSLLDELGEEKPDEPVESKTTKLPESDHESHQTSSSPKCLDSFIHIIQFCHLCSKGKIPPVHYSLAATPEIDDWFASPATATKDHVNAKLKCSQPTVDNSSGSDGYVSSPEQKIYPERIITS
jgi:hypothetical protein